MGQSAEIKIIECPRDAMQGIHDFIPTREKADYINLLLKVGFDTIDFGSFVSPKAIPQLKDTAQVLGMLELSATNSKLLAIVANVRGGEDAVLFDEISYLGFPFSVSETFQKRNTNSTVEDSLKTVEQLQQICVNKNKKLVVYLSMAFGNPYGDEWNTDIVIKWATALKQQGVEVISLADTVGVANPEDISKLITALIPKMDNIELGVHLHTRPNNWKNKVEAAYKSGCRRFDGAIRGFGGCPMADDQLTGNLATENLLQYLVEQNVFLPLNQAALDKAISFSENVFMRSSLISKAD
jgi:hydroxymethylglutaryl-CoA lyase